MKNFLYCMLFVLMVGCGGYVQKAPLALDSERKLFVAPKENLAGIYIYRTPGIRGSKINTEIFVNGKILGKNLGNTYLYVELPTGKHEITTYFVGYTKLTIEVEAGKLYFVQDFLKPKQFSNEVNLFFVDEEIGKKDVLKCELVSGTF